MVDEQIITDEDLQNSFMEKPLVIDEETMDVSLHEKPFSLKVIISRLRRLFFMIVWVLPW